MIDNMSAVNDRRQKYMYRLCLSLTYNPAEIRRIVVTCATAIVLLY